MSVKVWTEKVIIPTYEVGVPDKNPMFFEKRVYQGSSGVVYPNPIIEKIGDEKIDKEYEGVYLENKYLKILILPELGGRVQMAYDKIKERHFIYYNQVIKPALVGLCGPWISGGIEFNWPQHHRPSTFEPVEYAMVENEDGSATVWVNEVEKMFHTKGMAGFTLYPDKAYLEIKAKLNNLTNTPQTFLWWANPAVKVHDDYQSVFPPDVNAVFDHGKRDVSSFPIATGTYYKVDYSAGVDISRYKNIPVPTSYMAVNSNYNFVGGYEHNIQAGMLHVADHHVSPGKKQWTWGNGDFGLAWDRNLTDEDGPYIELMAGVFTDNQPDFTWLKPFEEKTFTQYFLPYRELGVVKNASKDVLISLDVIAKMITLKVFVTSPQEIKICLYHKNEVRLNKTIKLIPEDIFHYKTEADDLVNQKDLKVVILDTLDNEVLKYNPVDDIENSSLPEAAKPALLPHEIENNEQLFLTAQHLEQYRHATYRPMPYYLEAIKRDEGDIRCNNAIGMWYLKKGLFEESVPYFKKAVQTITRRNPNPYNCEPYYNLGLAYLFLHQNDAAYKAFFKATWDKSFQDTAYFNLAQIDYLRGDYASCLEHIDWALDKNARNGKAYVIKCKALQKLNKIEKASAIIDQALERDLFNLSALYEQYLYLKAHGSEEQATIAKLTLLRLSGQSAHNAIEYAIDYLNIGAYQEAIDLMKLVASKQLNQPLINYYIAYAYLQLNNRDKATAYFLRGADADPSYCFPNRLFDIIVLKAAITDNPKDSKAPYYLGNLYYDKQQYDLAINLWEQSFHNDDKFPTVLRNLGLAYFNKKQDQTKSLYYYEKAFELNTTDARILMELDSLYKKLNKSPLSRLNFLKSHQSTANQRDDLYLEMIALHNFLVYHQKAYDDIISRKFHPWEGGEGKVSGQFIYTLIALAKHYFSNEQFDEAIKCLEKAQIYPDNLGEGKLVSAQENEIFYWLGCCYEKLDQNEHAQMFWLKATQGINEPGMALFYNDQQPDTIFYQGCAWLKLGEVDKATTIFKKLIHYGEEHQDDKITLDYFAVSLPDLLIFETDLTANNKIHCQCIAALGYLGMGDKQKSTVLFSEVLRTDSMNFCAKSHLGLINDMTGINIVNS